MSWWWSASSSHGGGGGVEAAWVGGRRPGEVRVNEEEEAANSPHTHVGSFNLVAPPLDSVYLSMSRPSGSVDAPNVRQKVQFYKTERLLHALLIMPHHCHYISFFLHLSASCIHLNGAVAALVDSLFFFWQQ